MGRPITPQDLWTLARVGQPEHVPGTTTVVVPVVRYDDQNRARSTIHVVDRNGSTSALTSETRTCTSPVPSPGGDRIVFLGAEEDEPKQAYVMRLDGGDPRRP